MIYDDAGNTRRRSPFLYVLFEFTAVTGPGLLFALLAVGVPLAAATTIVLYVLCALPPIGSMMWHAGVAGSAGQRSDLAIYLVFGACVLPAVLFAFFVFSSLKYVGVLGIVVYLGFIAVNARKFVESDRKAERTNLYSTVLFSSLIAPLGVLAMSDQLSVVVHARVQGIIAQGLSYGWPPESPFLGGVPVGANYGVHLLLLSLSQVTGIRMDALVQNGAQTLILWLAIFGTIAVARRWLQLSLVAALSVAMAIFLVVGFSPIGVRWLGNAIPAAGVQTLSPLLGHLIFLAGGMALVNCLQREEKKHGILLLISFFLLGFSASLVRANSGVLLASTSSAYWLYLVVTRRRIEFHATLYVFLIGIGSVVGVAMTLGLPTPSGFSSARFLEVIFGGGALRLSMPPQAAIAAIALHAGYSAMAAGVFAFLFITLLPAGFLSPLFWWRVSKMRGTHSDHADVFLLLGFVLGFLLTFMTDAGGGSQFIFAQGGILSACLIGGRGLDDLISDIRVRSFGKSGTFRQGLVAVTTVGLAIHLTDAVLQTIRLGPIERAFATQPYPANDGSSDVDIEPLLDQLGDLSKVYFIVSENKAISGDQIQAWMTAYGIRLVAEQKSLQYYKMYGYSEIIERLAQSGGAFLKESRKGIVNLNCAYDVAKDSFVFDRRIVVLSPRTSAIVSNDNFTRVAETADTSAWEMTGRNNGGAGCVPR